jgi:hypothetical protein
LKLATRPPSSGRREVVHGEKETEGMNRPSLAAMAMLAIGCGSNQRLDQGPTNPPALRDTTGATFAWNCDLPLLVPDASAPNTCEIALRADSQPVPYCGEGSSYIYLNDQTLARICVVVPNDPLIQVAASMCRPVACGSTEDCPQFVESPFVCRNGLCRVKGTDDSALTVVDALALCLAGARRPVSCSAASSDTATLQAESLVEAHCGYHAASGLTANEFLRLESPCSVPATCRQP